MSLSINQCPQHLHIHFHASKNNGTGQLTVEVVKLARPVANPISVALHDYICLPHPPTSGPTPLHVTYHGDTK